VLRRTVRFLRARARAEWDRLLASPEEAGRLARGVGAGGFAAMLPAFGLHVLIALAVAWLSRGSRPAAAAARLLIGNPLTHAAVLPMAYELGHRVLPDAVVPGQTRLPARLAALLPIGERGRDGRRAARGRGRGRRLRRHVARAATPVRKAMTPVLAGVGAGVAHPG
jgi:hypothetical protein